MALGIGFIIGLWMAGQGRPITKENLGPLAFIDAGAVLICFVAAMIVAAFTAKPPQPPPVPPGGFPPPPAPPG